jgi:hypothetical protein
VSVSAQPSLWSSIVAALDRSRFVILLASRESDGSQWVAKEVDYCCAKVERRPRLLIALTDGEIEWDGAAASRTPRRQPLSTRGVRCSGAT